MADRDALLDQIDRCMQWIRFNAGDPDITPRATASVELLMRRLRRELKEAAANG